MDLGSLIGPAVVAALVSGTVAIIGYRYSAATAKAIHSERLEFEKVQSERKFDFDKELAQRKFEFDRAQLLHKRRFELAETLLTDAYHFEQIMRDARRSFGFAGEGESRKRPEQEADKLEEIRNTYYIPVERLYKEREFIAQFFAKQYSSSAHFGNRANEAFEHFALAANSVQIASEMLIRTANYPNNEKEFLDDMHSDLWIGYAKTFKREDKVAAHIKAAIELFEAICRPVLEWQGA